MAIPLFVANEPVGVLQFDSYHPALFSERFLPTARLLGVILVYLQSLNSRLDTGSAATALGKALSQVRSSTGLAPQTLASRLGITEDSLNRYEIGRECPSPDFLDAWLESLRLVDSASDLRFEVVDISARIRAEFETNPDVLVNLAPDQFECFVAERLEAMGYLVTLTGDTNHRDGGIDIVAVPRISTTVGFVVAAQVKHHQNGIPTTRADVDRLSAWRGSVFNLGLLVTNTRFTRDALWLAQQEGQRHFLRLRDYEDLKRWIRDDFATEYEWREIPDQIELAPGVLIKIPRPTILNPTDIWPESGPFIRQTSSVLSDP